MTTRGTSICSTIATTVPVKAVRNSRLWASTRGRQRLIQLRLRSGWMLGSGRPGGSVDVVTAAPLGAAGRTGAHRRDAMVRG